MSHGLAVQFRQMSLDVNGMGERNNARPRPTRLRHSRGRSLKVKSRERGRGPQLTNVAHVSSVAAQADQDAAARLLEAQNRYWRPIARGRRDLQQIEPRLGEPSSPRIKREAGGQQRDFATRGSGKGGEGKSPST